MKEQYPEAVKEADEFHGIDVPAENATLNELLNPDRPWFRPEGIDRRALKLLYRRLDSATDPSQDPNNLSSTEEGTYGFNPKVEDVAQTLEPAGQSLHDLSQHKKARRQIERLYEEVVRDDAEQDLTAL